MFCFFSGSDSGYGKVELIYKIDMSKVFNIITSEEIVKEDLFHTINYEIPNLKGEIKSDEGLYFILKAVPFAELISGKLMKAIK